MRRHLHSNKARRFRRGSMAGVAALVLMSAAPGDRLEAQDASASTAPAESASLFDPADAAASVSKAVSNLTAPNYSTRQNASAELQEALARQYASLLLLPDKEAASRGRHAVRVANSVSAWAMSVIGGVDSAGARQVLQFAFSKDVAPLLVGVMGDDLNQEREALGKIAALHDPRVADFFAALITVSDARHAGVAIDAAYDLKPSEALLKALWVRASKGFSANPFQRQDPMPGFQGKHVMIQQQYMPMYPDQTFVFAGDLLLKLKDPRTGDTFRRYVTRMAKVEGAGGGQGMGLSGFGRFNQPQAMQMFTQFATVFKVREVVPYLMTLATGDRTFQNGGGLPNRVVFCTNRTQMLGLVVTLTEQDPKEYFLCPYMWNPGDGMWSTDTDAHEQAAVEKAKAWWQKHQSEYSTATTTAPGATRPSITPAN